jgi:excisionase family DNA binding protein
MTTGVLLTVAQAAQRLGLSESTIRAWMAQRRLTFVRCGTAVRIPAGVVEDFIKSNTVGARKSHNEAPLK